MFRVVIHIKCLSEPDAMTGTLFLHSSATVIQVEYMPLGNPRAQSSKKYLYSSTHLHTMCCTPESEPEWLTFSAFKLSSIMPTVCMYVCMYVCTCVDTRLCMESEM